MIWILFLSLFRRLGSKNIVETSMNMCGTQTWERQLANWQMNEIVLYRSCSHLRLRFVQSRSARCVLSFRHHIKIDTKFQCLMAREQASVRNTRFSRAFDCEWVSKHTIYPECFTIPFLLLLLIFPCSSRPGTNRGKWLTSFMLCVSVRARAMSTCSMIMLLCFACWIGLSDYCSSLMCRMFCVIVFYWVLLWCAYSFTWARACLLCVFLLLPAIMFILRLLVHKLQWPSSGTNGKSSAHTLQNDATVKSFRCERIDIQQQLHITPIQIDLDHFNLSIC